MELRRWRRDEEDKEGYRERKREYREMCEQKKREESDRWEKETEQVRREEGCVGDSEWKRRNGEGVC